MKRVLVTGPVERLADYAAAARGVGWDAVEVPLLRIEPRTFAEDDLRSRRFDWICVTSANALPWLASALASSPDLRRVPCAVVGASTADRLRALGSAVEIGPTADAVALAEALADRAGTGKRILWPRGNLSDELARALVELGFEVESPIAYTAETLAPQDPVPEGAAVFFASPSAVRVWHETSNTVAPRVAIAIGRTTFDALLGETRARFFDTISLPEPTPEAFATVLAHLDMDPAS